MAVRAADWTLLTGGRYSEEVAVRTGLTVITFIFLKVFSFWNSRLSKTMWELKQRL